MDEYEMTKETYDKNAENYANKHPTLWEKEYKIIQKSLQQASTVLDVGCGPGRDTRRFLDSGFNVIGIDFSDGMLAEARKRVPEGDFQKMSMLELEFRADYFDALWVCASLLHIKREDATKALQEFNRVLKPGGIIFISVKKGEGSDVKAYPDGRKRFFTYYQIDELANLIQTHGFSITNSYEFKDKDNDTWLCVFAKKKG